MKPDLTRRFRAASACAASPLHRWGRNRLRRALSAFLPHRGRGTIRRMVEGAGPRPAVELRGGAMEVRIQGPTGCRRRKRASPGRRPRNARRERLRVRSVRAAPRRAAPIRPFSQRAPERPWRQDVGSPRARPAWPSAPGRRLSTRLASGRKRPLLVLVPLTAFDPQRTFPAREPSAFRSAIVGPQIIIGARRSALDAIPDRPQSAPTRSRIVSRVLS